jgi:hypothetical protein
MPYHSSHLVIISLLGLILLPVGIKGAGEDVITAEDLIEQVRILAARWKGEPQGRLEGLGRPPISPRNFARAGIVAVNTVAEVAEAILTSANASLSSSRVSIRRLSPARL